MSKKIIGVIGEHPNNDAEAIIALLQKYIVEKDWILQPCPLKINKPKEFLTEKTKNTTKKYDTSQAKIICSKLDFYKLYENHQGLHSFKAFADELKNKNIIDF
jgi:hypothetical protein